MNKILSISEKNVEILLSVFINISSSEVKRQMDESEKEGWLKSKK